MIVKDYRRKGGSSGGWYKEEIETTKNCEAVFTIVIFWAALLFGF